MGPGDLKTVLQNLPTVHHDQFLLGFHSSDDAAVTQLRPDLAIVQSLDFFMPIVDDPYTFGMIAAAILSRTFMPWAQLRRMLSVFWVYR